MERQAYFLFLEKTVDEFLNLNTEEQLLRKIILATGILNIGYSIMEKGYFEKLAEAFPERSNPGELKIHKVEVLCGDLIPYYGIVLESLVRLYEKYYKRLNAEDGAYMSLESLVKEINNIREEKDPLMLKLLLMANKRLILEVFEKITPIAKSIQLKFSLSAILKILKQRQPNHYLFEIDPTLSKPAIKVPLEDLFQEKSLKVD